MPDPGEFTIRFEGAQITARPGDTIAAALVAHGVRSQGTAKNGDPRGVFCGMGVCHDCLVMVDGRAAVRSCMTKAVDGMVVQQHHAKLAITAAHCDLAPVPEEPLAQEELDILVVGAGPGGLHAALAAAEVGTSVLVVDERPVPG